MRVLAGAARDWRGIAQAAHNRASYAQVFEALNPRHFDTLARGLELWADTPYVTTPLLKLYGELLYQRGQRINFGNNSPNGVLLFRAAARVVSAYGTSPCRATPLPDTQTYARLYKGVSICTSILSRALDGNFVNFAVFKLYNDPSMDGATGALLTLLLRIPPDDLFHYPKLTLLYMTLVNLLLRSFMEVIVALPAQYFHQVLLTLSRGMDSLEGEVSAQAASSIDLLATFFVRNERKDSPTALALKNHVGANPRVFHELMLTVFRVLVFDDSPSTHSLTRPLLPVVLAAQVVQPAALEEYKAELVASQPPEKRQRMVEEFNRLTEGVVKSLDMR